MFIDGSHTYEYVKNDTEKCLRIAGDGATLVWHDCDRTHPGVVRYLCELKDAGHDVVRIRRTPIAVLNYRRL